MKRILRHTLSLLLFSLVLSTAHAEGSDSPPISIKEALDLSLEKLPKGKDIQSILLQEGREGQLWYFAEYGEKIIAYEGQEMNADGDLIPCTKYRKVVIGIIVDMNGEVSIDQVEPRGNTPRRRVILPR